MEYGGFWIRVLASIIDGIIIGLVSLLLILLSAQGITEYVADEDLSWVDGVTTILGIAYYTGFHGSAMQATPGKRALGLIVTDYNGQRISYLRAFGRYWANLLSAMILFIGYIMVAFTERKQGLHDIICSTLVVRGNPGEVGVDTAVFE